MRGSAIYYYFGLKCFRYVKKAHFCGLVSGCGDEVCAVCGELNVVDLKVELVGLDVFQLFTRLVKSVITSLGFLQNKRV